MRLSDSKLGRPGPEITSGRPVALTTLAARRRRAEKAENVAILRAAKGLVAWEMFKIYSP